MNNYLTPSQSTTTNSIYNNLIGISNYDPFATSALASTLNKNYGLEQSRTNFDDDLRHRITDTDSMSSTPEQDRDRQIDAELYPELSNKYYSGLDYNDQNIISQGSSENELHDGLYREPQTPEVKTRFADDHMSSSPYQPLGDLSNDKPPRDSASTQESSPNRSNDEDDEGVESSLKNHSVSSGLPNLGNTCYMNSVLQCLFNTEKLSSLLEKNRQYIEKSESAPITNTFMEALAQAFTQNSSTRNMSTSLKTFKRALEKVAPIFKGYSQNDAHELFRSLTEKMHDEINHAPKKSGSYVEFTPSDQKNIHQIAEEWKNYSKDRDDSLFTSLFGGILLTEVKCNHCGHVSYTFEDAVDLSLNIANLKVEDSGYVTKLNTCLKDFAEPEFVDGYACDGCKRRDSSYKRTTVWKQPETLVVQLKRFVYDMYGELSAVKDSVAFPLDDLTLDEITHEESNERKERYKLYGIVNHMGSLNFGHYIAFVYNEEQGCWYQYNDDSVTKIDEDDMIEYARGSSEPYILFYKRV